MHFRFFTLRLAVAVCFTSSLVGCASSPQYNEQQKAQLSNHDVLIEQAEQFVHANLFTGMIHVWEQDRRPWNALLGAYSCGIERHSTAVVSSYEANHPVFAEAMTILASNQDMFTNDEEKAALQDVSKLAYRLFSASYAKGYARQVSLADSISPGIHEELCGGRIIRQGPQKIDYPEDIQWSSFNTSLLEQNNGLQAHAQNGDKAFQTLLNQQYAQFDALVYSHAYQQTDAYETLFFEVNKFENVEQYGKQVRYMASIRSTSNQQNDEKHNDFAYLVLTSGYHWGMMSVLAMLEEEYPRLHDSKKQQATAEVEAVTTLLDQESD